MRKLSVFSLALLSLSAHAAFAQVRVTTAPLAVQTQAIFQEQCKRDRFSGALLVEHKRDVIVESACGEASKRYHVPNKIDTKFNVASIGKMFTAVAIAQLMEAGKLSYDDKISKYVDASWLPASVTERITVGQLLAHSSGLANFMTTERAYHSSRALYREHEDVKPFLQGMTPEFEPGTRYYYSNTGYLLLGVIIEKVSGQNYYDYIRQHIYQVADMKNSDSYFLDEPVENLAMGYMDTPDKGSHSKEATFAGLLRGFAFGCGYSTVRDLLNFTHALQDGRLIKPGTLKTMWQNHAPQTTDKNGGYGYGFELRTSATGPVVGHSGQFPGVNGNVDIYPDKDYTVIVLSNYGSNFPMADKVGDLIANDATGEKIGEPLAGR